MVSIDTNSFSGMFYFRLNWKWKMSRVFTLHNLLHIFRKLRLSCSLFLCLNALSPIFSLTYYVLLQGCDTASPVSRAVPSVGVQPLHVSLQPQQTVRVEGPSPTPATPTTGELPFLFGSPDLRVIHVSFFSFCQRVSYAMGFVWYNLFSGNKLLSINQEH